MTDQQTTGRRLPEWALMYVIHDAFRRDLQALEATQAGLPAVRARWAVFADQLHFHHLAEDQVMWPPVRARLAGDPDGLALMDAMDAEHAQIDPLLDAVDGALAADDTGHAGRAAALARLHATLAGHLAHEETDVLPLISRVMTEAGVAAIFEAFGKLGGLRRGATLLPWALSSASPDVRAQVLRRLPPPARLLYRAVWVPRYRRTTPPL
jgi:hypothetical protein